MYKRRFYRKRQKFAKMPSMKRLLFILFLFTITFTNVHAQTAAESHTKIREALERREYLIVVSHLDGLAKADRKAFELNNYDYLLARMAERTGDHARAMANYQSVVKRGSVLKPYALWHISQVARATGNLLLERTNLQELMILVPESLLYSAAKNRMARNFVESGNYAEAVRLLSESFAPPAPGSKPTDSRLQRENQALMARAYLYSGDTAKAREAFMALIQKQVNPAQPDDYALAAAKGLDAIDGGQENLGKKAPKISDPEHVQRARIYQFNRDFEDARLHYRAVIDDYPSSENVPDATYQIGRCYILQREFVEGVHWFERTLEQFPDHPISKDALSQAASGYSRVNKPKEAITRYHKFIEKYPDDERIDRPYLNIIDIHRDQGEDTDALKWAAKTQEVFKGKLPEALAVFSQARIRIARADWASALPDLERLVTFPDLGGTRVAGGTNTAEIMFLKAFVLEQMQRYSEAIDVYLSIPDGRAEYYGWRSTERLKALANNEKAASFLSQKLGALTTAAASKDHETVRKSAQAALRLTDSPDVRTRMLEAIKKAYASLPAYQKVPSFKLLEFDRSVLKEPARNATTTVNEHQAIADELIFLGLFDEATPELEAARSQTVVTSAPATSGAKPAPSNTDLNYTLAVFYRRGDMANRAVAFAEPLWRSVPADYQIELIPVEQAALLYPAPYADALLKHSPQRDVDPRFLLSIMRQESRYRADVKSYAAARGLMQFISSTSDKIAVELGRKTFKQDELYDPSTAVLFGSQYVANIFKLFPRQAEAVAASYNGGEDNMQRWLSRSQADVPDRYVPEIVFSQSKDYVYKVMANYRMYRLLYDENLKPR